MATTSAPAEVLLSGLLKQPVVDGSSAAVGRLADVIVSLHTSGYPPVTGLVVHTGGRDVFISGAELARLAPDRVEVTSAPARTEPFARREGEVLLRADVLGHRLLDVTKARLVRAYDVSLTPSPNGGWQVAGVDVHPARVWHVFGRHPHPLRDWNDFEALIGHRPSALVRARFGRVRRLKAAQIADLLESADRDEQTEILEQVHGDPELEADVFEELDDEKQSRLLSSRSDADISELLARMRADDAADALLDLPQERRRGVLDALPAEQRRKVTTLLGYNETTAGGLMGVDYLALPSDATVTQALAEIGAARTNQPEALVAVYLSDADGRLTGVIGLVALLQAVPGATLADLADRDPVRVHPEADIIDVARNMADYNLLTLPVVDAEHRLIGLITVDDVLEAVLPANWRHREAAPSARSAPRAGGAASSG